MLCGGVVASGVIGGAFDCVVYDVVVVVLVGGVNAVVVGVSAFLVFVGTFTMKIVVTVVVVDFSLLSVSINI